MKQKYMYDISNAFVASHTITKNPHVCVRECFCYCCCNSCCFHCQAGIVCTMLLLLAIRWPLKIRRQKQKNNVTTISCACVYFFIPFNFCFHSFIYLNDRIYFYVSSAYKIHLFRLGLVLVSFSVDMFPFHRAFVCKPKNNNRERQRVIEFNNVDQLVFRFSFFVVLVLFDSLLNHDVRHFLLSI